ncbi:unnamed protein product [Protopolystoma xenopodis]|uniref:Uncharacterized protein n=1 Tax=Protopolystoma xenopodis TaxID=117903 RepID=A0A3S5CTJ7_9PLAT|nr:unnamed protein product [Protopolystoma xenopodis]
MYFSHSVTVKTLFSFSLNHFALTLDPSPYPASVVNLALPPDSASKAFRSFSLTDGIGSSTSTHLGLAASGFQITFNLSEASFVDAHFVYITRLRFALSHSSASELDTSLVSWSFVATRQKTSFSLFSLDKTTGKCFFYTLLIEIISYCFNDFSFYVYSPIPAPLYLCNF